MNAKKKNKKANKPPNPNPPQKSENVPKIEEKVEEIQPKCEVKEQILTQQIVSEVVGAPVIDATEMESETPNKPKRNKSKKKKSDKIEELVENVQEKPQEVQTVPIVKVEEKVQEIRVVEKETEEMKNILDDTCVVPSARKKKNKKKGQEKLEESKAPSDISVPIPKEDTIGSIKKVDQEIQELFLSKPETLLDPKKKKNKKKNRTDSERSDKSDTAVSCTTAFQKLLAEEKKPQQEQPEVMVEDSQDSIRNLPLEPESKATEKSVLNIVDIQLIDEIKETAHDKPQDVKELPKDEPKGKKKNKKDKKQQQKELFEDPKPEPQKISEIIDNVSPQTVPYYDPKQDVKETIEVPLDSKKEREPSPKPKAKIAKPVEKKRKGKQEAQSTENLLDIEGAEIIKEDTEDKELSKESEIKSDETPTVTMIESQDSDKKTQELTIRAVENINVPSDNAMGKKRKKSPKPPKHKEVKSDIVETPEKIPPEAVPEIKDLVDIDVSDMSQSQIQIVSSTPAEKPPKIFELVPIETLEPRVDQIIEKTETILLEQPLTPDAKKDDEGFEIKTSKKKKKTPKVPQVEISSEVKESTTPEIAKTDDKGEKPMQFHEEKIDFPLDISFAADLGTQSIKIDAIDALSCDAIPDVLFVRSSSQHHLDDNNNTVIQEVINVEDIKLNDPLFIPLVEGSGETPIRTPEIITSGISMTHIEVKTSIDEKTDIKSKIMEVNQDMEELRLSIERSIAEFTSLEKSEHEIENKCKGNITAKKEKSPFKDSESKATRNISLKKEKSPFKDSGNKATKLEEPVTIEKKENIPGAGETKEIDKPSLISEDVLNLTDVPPVCPARKDNKGKSKSKKKGRQEITPATTTAPSESITSQSKDNTKEEKQEKTEQKSEQKSESTQEKGKQQSDSANHDDCSDTSKDTVSEKPINTVLPETPERNDFEPIENFEDALTSSIDDVNKTFEMIAKGVNDENDEYQKKLAANKPKINITEPTEDEDTNRNEKVNPVSQPKNLLGQTDIPVQSNRTDYKKEKNKTPNARQARVKIKDSMDVEAKKQCKESQTDNTKAKKNSDKSVKESFSRVKNDNEEYVYKYSFRKVFLQSACHVCNKDLQQVRVPCGYCSLVFYCSARHKDENWPQHQALCFAVSTLAHMKDQKHIYTDAQHATGQDYRLLRMQMIVSCEKILKRRLVPWEQEAMLYPRICADVACREWRQGKLKDCDGCGQLSFCAEHPEHLPKTHSRWCKSYNLYRRLVGYQQTKGRLEPRLPTKVLAIADTLEKMNDVLAALYEEKIDMNDIQYAALTQLATAPLTASYCLQVYRKGTSSVANGFSKKHPFIIHVVGAELQFEADALHKWETFFLHLRPEVGELTVVLVSPMLNPGNLPLDLLGKINLCDNCRQNKRRVVFKFEDNKNYFEYRSSENFINPDIICAFNPSIQRSSIYNGKDPWPATINSILKLKELFIITSYTLNELRKDVARIKQVTDLDFKLVLEPGFNNFASVRPDRNFISDDEIPLLFKNYCVAAILGC